MDTGICACLLSKYCSMGAGICQLFLHWSEVLRQGRHRKFNQNVEQQSEWNDAIERQWDCSCSGAML